MSKEKAAAAEEKEQKSGLRIAQVMAAALAAVTAALLGSTLGVAGTVIGAGVASVVSTVGSELYLRSLERTREAALRARQLATSGIRRRGHAEEAPAEVPITDQPTVRLAKPETAPLSARLRKLRWPLIIGTSVVAFAVAILSMIGVDAASGGKVAGGTGASVGKLFGGSSGQEDKTPATTPPTSTNDTQVSPTETTTAPTGTSTAPTSSETPTTTPSTTSEQPSTSAPATTATPPTSKGAAPTPTP
ncbi:hypothetical protein [Amycolatopsis sp. lyj-23]|uniref:hypothetical protein n=1 Tax=Amycolatopsis sp. lyj-23 TaxID=2789283 RepID=UPI00397CAEB5